MRFFRWGNAILRAGLETIFVALSLGGIAYYLLAIRSIFAFRSRETKSGRCFAPPISILKPLRGLDPQAYENLRSHCYQDYPAYEVVFGVVDPADPIVGAVQRLILEFPALPIKLVVCGKRAGANLKVSSLLQMLPVATYQYVVVNDSDIAVGSDYLRQVAASLEDPLVGMVTCLYRGIPAPSLGSRLEAAGIYSDFVPGVLCANFLDSGLKFAMGSTMAFRRDSLAVIGGLESLADYLADDFELGNRLWKAGRRVELADCVVDHRVPQYTPAEFFQHQLRWARTIRSSRPAGYAGLVITFALPWSVLALILSHGSAWAWLVLVVVAVLRFVVATICGLKVLQDAQTLRALPLLPLRDVLALLVWIASYAGKSVVWRGERFEIVKGKLRPA